MPVSDTRNLASNVRKVEFNLSQFSEEHHRDPEGGRGLDSLRLAVPLSHLRDASRRRIAYWSLSGHSPSKASPRISPVAGVKLTNEPQVTQVL
jgi:hypothetical protein